MRLGSIKMFNTFAKWTKGLFTLEKSFNPLFFGPDQNTMHCVPFHAPIFMRVSGFECKLTCVQRSFNYWTKQFGGGQGFGVMGEWFSFTELQVEIWSIRSIYSNVNFAISKTFSKKVKEDLKLQLMLAWRLCTTRLSTMLTKTTLPMISAALEACYV